MKTIVVKVGDNEFLLAITPLARQQSDIGRAGCLPTGTNATTRRVDRVHPAIALAGSVASAFAEYAR